LKEHLLLWLHKKEALISFPNPLLVLAVLLITGYIFTKISEKIKLPAVTGQIIGGIVLGHYILNVFPKEAYSSFAPITNFALGFIGLTIGSHLDFRKLQSAGKRIIMIAVIDAVFTFLLIFSALHYLARLRFDVSLLVSAIAITTAPGSTLHIIREKRAKGILSKTILAVVAVNNVLTILIFYAAFYYLYYNGVVLKVDVLNTILKPFMLLLESIVIGSIVGFLVIYFTEYRKTRASFLIIVILAVVVTVGTSESLHLSGILSSLILGIIITNFSRNRKLIFSAFKDIETEVFTLFFVLAGTHLDFKAIQMAKFGGIVLILSRLAGKTFFPVLGAFFANSTATIRKWIGFSLYPIAGVAIGLMLLVENNIHFVGLSSEITAIVLSAVVVFELFGPLATGFALKKSGEINKNRIRLMDFIQEEYIKICVEAEDKWQALDTLAEFLYKSHKIREISLEDLKKSIVEREKEISTGIGDNLAIPHAIIEGGPKIRGVIGISRKGINFESIDGQPVHIIVLIATPKKNYDLHLHVLANIAKIFGHNPEIKNRLVQAKSPEEVFEILQSEEVENLNPFFEE